MIGHNPGIKRFVKGHIYKIQTQESEKWILARFRNKSNAHYNLLLMADNLNRPYKINLFRLSFTFIDTRAIEEIPTNDLPLYITAPHLYLEFERAMKDLPLVRRKLSKIRRDK